MPLGCFRGIGPPCAGLRKNRCHDCSLQDQHIKGLAGTAVARVVTERVTENATRRTFWVAVRSDSAAAGRERRIVSMSCRSRSCLRMTRPSASWPPAPARRRPSGSDLRPRRTALGRRSPARGVRADGTSAGNSSDQRPTKARASASSSTSTDPDASRSAQRPSAGSRTSMPSRKKREVRHQMSGLNVARHMRPRCSTNWSAGWQCNSPRSRADFHWQRPSAMR